MKDLSIILCTFNEAKRIGKSLETIKSTILNWDIQHEIIIIDNNSYDGTKNIINKFEYSHCKKIFNEMNIGKGGSIKKAISYSEGKYIMIFDPDLEYLPTDIIRMFDYTSQNKLDFVIGSRRLNKKIKLYDLLNDKNKGITYLINYFGVFFLTGLINILYKINITDSASALKLFKKNFIDIHILTRNGFNLDFELVCKHAMFNAKFGEIEIEYFPRSKKEGKKIKAISDGLSSLFCIIYDKFFYKVEK